MTGSQSGGQLRLIVIAASVSALLGVLASLLAVGYLRQNELRNAAHEESLRANDAAQQAQAAANLGNRARDEAEEMVEFILNDLRDELSGIGRSDLLVAAAGKAAEYFDHLPPELVTRESKIKQASVLFTLAQTRQDTGDLEGAISACQRCIELRRDIAATDDPDGYQSYRLGRTYGELGHFYKAAGDLEAARRSYETGLNHFRNPPPGADTEGDWKYGQAQSLNGLASIEAAIGSADVALTAHQEAIGYLTSALAKRPDEVLWINQLGLAHNNSGVIHRNAGDYPAAEKSYQGALAAVRELIRVEPENRHYEKQLATVLGNLGRLYKRLDDPERAEQYLRESLSVRQGLVSWDSKNTRWLLDLAHGWGYLADFQFEQEQSPAAWQSIQQALETYQRLFEIEAGHASWVDDFQSAITDYRDQLVDAGMKPEALHLIEQSAAFAESTRAGEPGSEVWDETLEGFYRDIRQLGGVAASASLIEPRRRTLATLARRLNGNPASPEANYRWAVACIGLGRAFHDAGLPGSATPCLRIGYRVLRDRVPAGHQDRDAILTDAQRQDVRWAIERGEIQEPIALVNAGASWRYWDRTADPGIDWATTTFDDSGWKEGPAPLGYGEADLATVLSYGSNRRQKPITAWFRHRFELSNPTNITHLHIGVRRDDGAVIYLNGREIVRDGLPPEPVTPDTPARMTQDLEENVFHVFRVDAADLTLVQGSNLLAVEVHQNEPMSSDLCLDLEVLPNFSPPDPVVDLEALATILEDALPKSVR